MPRAQPAAGQQAVAAVRAAVPSPQSGGKGAQKQTQNTHTRQSESLEPQPPTQPARDSAAQVASASPGA